MKYIPDENFLSYRVLNDLLDEKRSFDIGKRIALLIKNISTDRISAEENGSYELICKKLSGKFRTNGKICE